jgi:hypothetical protein
MFGFERFSYIQIISSGFFLLAVIAFLLVGQLKYTFIIEYSVEVLNVTGSSFHYNLWGSLSKLWDEELYFLYAFLLIWSGLWPFLKLLLLTILIVYPFSNDFKLRYLDWIATLGVWSFADIWVVVMISIVLNAQKTINIDESTSITAELQVTPLDGVIILFFGLFLSQLINIGAIFWYHSKSTSASLGAYTPLALSATSEGDGTHDNEDHDFPFYCCCLKFLSPKQREVIDWLAKFSYITLLIFFFVGMFFLPILKINYVVMKKYDSVSEYSVFSGIMHLEKVVSESQGEGKLGQYFLFLISMIFVVVFPIVQQAGVAFIWGLPQLSANYAADMGLFTSPKTIRRINRLMEVISHFCSLEVFLVSCFFVSHELGSLLSNLALGKYLTIEITILPQFYVFGTVTVILSIAKCYVWQGYIAAGASDVLSVHTNDTTRVRPLMAEYGRGNSIVL